MATTFSVASLWARPSQAPATVDLNVAALLELYESGKHEDAIAQVKAAGDQAGRRLRAQLRTEGSNWIDLARPNHAPRLLVTAAFTLETEILRVERGDWGSMSWTPGPSVIFGRGSDGTPGVRPIQLPPPPCQTICMLEWARMLLIERGQADDPVRAWFHGALALSEGQSNWRFVYTLLGPEAPAPARGLAHEAITAFPKDPWFQFDRALALAARYNVTRDGIAPGSTVIVPAQPPPPVVTRFQGARGTVTRYRLGGGAVPETATADLPAPAPVSALAEMVRLSADPVVGIDAQIRLGYLQWATGTPDAARATLVAAAGAAPDADRRYLAHFLAGWIAFRNGDHESARASLTAALEARPNSQSAVLALASLDLRHGDADAAHRRAEAALAERPTDDDPWRLFLYGRFPMLPQLVAQLRAQLLKTRVVRW